MKKTVLFFIFISGISLYAKTVFIENESIVNDGKIDKYISQIITEYLYEGTRVYVIGEKRDKAKEKIIKEKLSLKQFRYSFIAKLYLFFNKKSFVYASSEKLINYLFHKKYNYINVVYEPAKFSDKELLTLKDKNNAKMLLSETARTKLNIEIDKEKIIVLDGDTFIYENIRYRLLGIDAAEILQVPYGEYGSNFTRTKIKNAKEVFLKTADRDIYDRVLTHVIVDGIPLSFMLMENKLAIQTVTTYGDNGYPDIAEGIIERAKKQGRLKFKKPSTFRKEERKLNSSSENEEGIDTEKKIYAKKTPKAKTALSKKSSDIKKTDKKTKTAKPKKKKEKTVLTDTNEIKEPKKRGRKKKSENTIIDINENQNENIIFANSNEARNGAFRECSQINILIDLLKERGFSEAENITSDAESLTIVMEGYYDKIGDIDIDEIELKSEHTFSCKCHNYEVWIIER